VRLAAQALRGAGLTRRQEPEAALGFPTPLCAALAGASGLLRSVDEVRTLAISVFRAVPPRERTPRLAPSRLVEVALWSARRGQSFQQAPAALGREVGRVIDGALAGDGPGEGAIWELSGRLQRAISRLRLQDGQTFHPGRLEVSAFYFALHALRKTTGQESPAENVDRACRDAARLATLLRGLDGAVPLCLDLAAELGM
jgi:hypothetical protein